MAVRGEPQREVAARRVADGDDAAHVEPVVGGEVREVRAAQCDVVEGARPTAAGLADASKFEVPGCQSSGGERRAQVANVRQVVLGAPESAMDHNRHGVWPSSGRYAQLAEL